MIKIMSAVLIITGMLMLLGIFGPIIWQEIDYQFNQVGQINKAVLISRGEKEMTEIEPVDRQFGLVIPKIKVNVKVFPEIDPTNPAIYLPILKKGVAQAKGSAFPDQKGNVFIFAHSTDTFYNISHYNAVFFLLGKLEKGDQIDLYYEQKLYQYQVIRKAVVSPENLEKYVQENTGQNSLTLQTCYPPGTTLKRLMVIATTVS